MKKSKKSMLAAVTGIATAAMLGAAAMPANAQGTPTPGARATLRAAVGSAQHPMREVVSCAVTAQEPDFLVSGSETIYASGKFGSCSSPAPDECHLTVSIANGGFSDVAHKDGGWRSCTSQTLKVSYHCAGVVGRHPYTTVATLAIHYQGQAGSKVVHSHAKTLWCG
ncbi:hypothetical protein ABZW44_29655 [Streptomyces mirabilis]|uniref:hypothetical protein n=2 Tax=Streptomyces mirabilis TaxID=68239 RepID=UPI0033346B9A